VKQASVVPQSDKARALEQFQSAYRRYFRDGGKAPNGRELIEKRLRAEDKHMPFVIRESSKFQLVMSYMSMRTGKFEHRPVYRFENAGWPLVSLYPEPTEATLSRTLEELFAWASSLDK